MLNLQLNYTHPWLLLLIIPAILLTLLPYFLMNKKYRRTRNRIVSMVLHSIAMVIAINLLAGISFRYEIPNAKNEILLLVDVSDSSEGTRADKDDFVQTVINICGTDYKVGVVKFGYGCSYVAELTDDPTNAYENYLTSKDPDTTATDLATALEYTASLFTNSESAKIVLISDGIETDQAATAVIKGIAADGIMVDTVYYPNNESEEMQILSVKMPDQHVIPGEAFTAEVTLKSNFGKGEQNLELSLYDNGEKLGTTAITVSQEEQTVPINILLESRGMHELRFEIAHPKDTESKNNAYHSFINLEEFENVLLLERYENETQKLQEILNENFKVTSFSVEKELDMFPRTLQEMAEYEQVILANIAYSDMPAGFEELLNEYVYSLGGGLFTVGGKNELVNGTLVPHAYNRVDLEKSTYYKQMLPINAVDFTPPIALMIVVDTSGSMSMGKLPAAIEGAEACLDTLSDRDFCGVYSFSEAATENLQILPVSRKDEIREAIRAVDDNTEASGGTIFAKAIEGAGLALSAITNVERKHIIIVSDGDPGDEARTEDGVGYLDFTDINVAKGITMSVVTVGDIDAGKREKMTELATLGGGKFYNVAQSQLQTIPTVMQQDLALEAIPEIAYGEEFIPQIKEHTTVVAGIAQNAIPPLTGYYGTVAKKDAVVTLMGKYVPIYAHWKYGAGNVGSFMCDLNGEWSGTFVEDLIGKAIVTNIVRSIFPKEDVQVGGFDYSVKTDNYTTQLNIYNLDENHRIEVSVKPLSASLAELANRGIPVKAQEGNRRFSFEIKDAGLYEVTIEKFDENGVLLSDTSFYKTFSYSEEYNAFPTRTPLGEELMTLLANDGRGLIINDPADVFQNLEKTLKREYDPRIPLLILAIVLFLLDIAVRKFKFKWPHELIREHKQKKADAAAAKLRTTESGK